VFIKVRIFESNRVCSIMMEECFYKKRFSLIPRVWRNKKVAAAIHEHLVEELWYDNILLLIGSVTSSLSVLITFVRNTILPYIAERKHKKDMGKAGSLLKAVRDGVRNERMLKYDVFLSYSEDDWERVNMQSLRIPYRKKYKVCFEEVSFPYGCSISKEIAEAIYIL